jgi:hypothetical protein
MTVLSKLRSLLFGQKKPTRRDLDRKLASLTDQIFARNQIWTLQYDDRPIPERPGYAEDMAALDALHKEVRALNELEKSEFQLKRASGTAALAAAKSRR